MSELDSKKLIIITAPSGSGKSSIVSYLLEKYPFLSFSISACTRNPRPNEQNGVHYYFLSLDSFETKIKQDAFAEYEMVYPGKYYGTLKSELEKAWAIQKTPIADIDVKGALRLIQYYGSNSLSLFIKTPTLEILRTRLLARGTETAISLEERLHKAEEELSYASYFNHQIINDQLETACKEVEEKILAFLHKTI
ncbi:MAG: guanylate kinase [Chitinophagaceae bacterium]|nr:guanylate kinase [Chitinophagaceae bacterium]